MLRESWAKCINCSCLFGQVSKDSIFLKVNIPGGLLEMVKYEPEWN